MSTKYECLVYSIRGVTYQSQPFTPSVFTGPTYTVYVNRHDIHWESYCHTLVGGGGESFFCCKIQILNIKVLVEVVSLTRFGPHG